MAGEMIISRDKIRDEVRTGASDVEVFSTSVGFFGIIVVDGTVVVAGISVFVGINLVVFTCSSIVVVLVAVAFVESLPKVLSFICEAVSLLVVLADAAVDDFSADFFPPAAPQRAQANAKNVQK